MYKARKRLSQLLYFNKRTSLPPSSGSVPSTDRHKVNVGVDPASLMKDNMIVQDDVSKDNKADGQPSIAENKKVDLTQMKTFTLEDLYDPHIVLVSRIKQYFIRLTYESENFWCDRNSCTSKGSSDVLKSPTLQAKTIAANRVVDDPLRNALLNKLADHVGEMVLKIDICMSEGNDRSRKDLGIGFIILICGLIFLDRLPRNVLSKKNVFSLVGVALGTAVKVMFDKPPTNKRLASIAKIVDLTIYNAMEARFCSLLHFNFSLNELVLKTKEMDLGYGTQAYV